MTGMLENGKQGRGWTRATEYTIESQSDAHRLVYSRDDDFAVLAPSPQSTLMVYGVHRRLTCYVLYQTTPSSTGFIHFLYNCRAM